MREGHRLAIYLPSLRGGGAERIMVTLANSFAALGHSVDLVLVKAEGPYLDEVSEAVRVVDLNRPRVLASLPSLVRYLRREQPDAVLSALSHANLVAIMARGVARVDTRLVISERSSLTGRWTDRRGRILRRLMQWLYPQADSVIAVSRGIADQLVTELRLNPGRVTDIPNPVDITRIASLAAERPQHAWLVPGAPPVILAVGRLVPEKDYPTLLAAFARLRAARGNLRLVILGEGDQRASLERHIDEAGLGESVLLAGFVPNPFAWMAACAVYVMSSRREGFPNSLIQAMACGARVVSTDCLTGPGEILEGGRWGLLAPVGEPEALAGAIGTALDNPSPPDGRHRASNFAIDRAVASYMDAFGLGPA